MSKALKLLSKLLEEENVLNRQGQFSKSDYAQMFSDHKSAHDAAVKNGGAVKNAVKFHYVIKDSSGTHGAHNCEQCAMKAKG